MPESLATMTVKRNECEARLLPSVCTLLCICREGEGECNGLRQPCRLCRSQRLVPDGLATMNVKRNECEARLPDCEARSLPSVCTLLCICREGEGVCNGLQQPCRRRSQQLVPEGLAAVPANKKGCEARLLPSVCTLLCICREGEGVCNGLQQPCRRRSQQLVPEGLAAVPANKKGCEARLLPSVCTLLCICRKGEGVCNRLRQPCRLRRRQRRVPESLATMTVERNECEARLLPFVCTLPCICREGEGECNGLRQPCRLCRSQRLVPDGLATSVKRNEARRACCHPFAHCFASAEKEKESATDCGNRAGCAGASDLCRTDWPR